MKALLRGLVLAALLVAPVLAAADSTVYELRTYTATPGNLNDLLERFADHTCKLFERHGMTNVGYWLPTDEKDGRGDKLIYLLAHKSRDAAKESWKAFGADPEWKQARAESEANGKIVAQAESVFLTLTDFSPPFTSIAAHKSHVFEMRTYLAADGKLADLDARFRQHTIALFAKHGMTNVAYFHPTDAEKGAANTLIYFLVHANRDAAAASWAAFRADPVWLKARADSEKNGKLTAEVKSVFLRPLEDLPMR